MAVPPRADADDAALNARGLSTVDVSQIPSVLLHDHLDGGVRPETMVTLAAAAGLTHLPHTNPQELAHHFAATAVRGSLPSYLDSFALVYPLLRSAQVLTDIAHQAVVDTYADGVAYAEFRFAPTLHIGPGLSVDDVVAAVCAGLQAGVAACDGFMVAVPVLAVMRDDDEHVWWQVARAADRFATGFDVAGPERGWPVRRCAPVFEWLADADVPVTVHAGEDGTCHDIAAAVLVAGARRVGHGTALARDTGFVTGLLATRRVLVEACVSSNVHTGACSTAQDHPLMSLLAAGVPVCVNTDNRTFSATSMSQEVVAAATVFGLSDRQLARCAVDAVAASFAPNPVRVALLEHMRPSLAAAGVQVRDADVTAGPPASTAVFCSPTAAAAVTDVHT